MPYRARLGGNGRAHDQSDNPYSHLLPAGSIQSIACGQPVYAKKVVIGQGVVEQSISADLTTLSADLSFKQEWNIQQALDRYR